MMGRGGGKPFAALSVGSRGFVKLRNVKCHFAGPTETDERSERITETAPHPEIELASPEGAGRWRGRARGVLRRGSNVRVSWERAARALRVRRLDRSATTTASWLA
jgi:hypothetical protein